jgi:hypothetical protein
LSDLVDLAVDAGEAVLREPDGDYLVQYGDVVYRYRPPDPETVREQGGFDLRDGLPRFDPREELPALGLGDDTPAERLSRADGGDVADAVTHERVTESDDWEGLGGFVGSVIKGSESDDGSDTDDGVDTDDTDDPGADDTTRVDIDHQQYERDDNAVDSTDTDRVDPTGTDTVDSTDTDTVDSTDTDTVDSTDTDTVDSTDTDTVDSTDTDTSDPTNTDTEGPDSP